MRRKSHLHPSGHQVVVRVGVTVAAFSRLAVDPPFGVILVVIAVAVAVVGATTVDGNPSMKPMLLTRWITGRRLWR